eukprot:CAMPEP_0197040390 /NCGR_PEP_ID=MMETSP1384-20130603/17097_1 /TAXON_ID=29189 /ORGANISM="Ammonia sp." /LENGTH=94 /DNA_ID=CAMNT_0042471133 /DNA_START=42 /DNA_END=326 /DNA_ORIENTATION=-
MIGVASGLYAARQSAHDHDQPHAELPRAHSYPSFTDRATHSEAHTNTAVHGKHSISESFIRIARTRPEQVKSVDDKLHPAITSSSQACIENHAK